MANGALSSALCPRQGEILLAEASFSEHETSYIRPPLLGRINIGEKIRRQRVKTLFSESDGVLHSIENPFTLILHLFEGHDSQGIQRQC